MSLKRRMAAIFGAAILAIGVVAPSAGAESADIPIDVEVGTSPDAGLSWNAVETSPFAPVAFSLEDQTTNSSLAATITDTRGTRAGWALSVSAPDLRGQETGETIPIGNYSIKPGQITVVAGEAEPMPTANSLSLSTEPQVLISAAPGAGNGRYSVMVKGTLLIPGATVVDVYSTTLTVELAAAP